MAILAAVTGVRASELFALSWAAIDFERQVIHIRRSSYRGEFGPPKSKANERAIAILQNLFGLKIGCRLGPAGGHLEHRRAELCDPRWAMQALLERIEEKRNKPNYGNLKTRHGAYRTRFAIRHSGARG
jgi:integrase